MREDSGEVSHREAGDPGGPPPGGSKGPVRVGILGATGVVGQKLVALLTGHPWFHVGFLTGSRRSAGRAYGEVVRWLDPTPLPNWAGPMEVRESLPWEDCDLAFSALDADAAEEVEPAFLAAGIPVLSNARTFRNDPRFPLVVPEVNPHHLEILRGSGGKEEILVTNPNCSTTGLVMALKPLADAFPLRRVMVTTLQAVSGAGHPGVPSMDILGNVVPLIPGEEEKLETEPLRILGTRVGREIRPAPLAISAQANRVPVLDGHLLSVSVGFDHPVPAEAAVQAFHDFCSPLRDLALPSAPEKPLLFRADPYFPQPRLHAGICGGMTVSVGRLRRCPVLDLRFVVLVHNTLRGAGGGAVLNGELVVARGLLARR